MAFLPAEIVSDTVIYPTPDVVERLVFLRDLGDVEDTYNTAWERIRG